MTAKKLKTSLTAIQGQRAIGASTETGRISSSTAAQKSQVPRTSGVKAGERQILRMEVPEGVDMDVLAEKIATRMRGAEIASNAVQGQNIGQTNGASFAASAGHTQDPGPASPIDSAFFDLSCALNDLETETQLLIKSIDPILLYDSGNKMNDCAEAMTVSISPLHNRLIDLKAQVRSVTARLANARDRVQL